MEHCLVFLWTRNDSLLAYSGHDWIVCRTAEASKAVGQAQTSKREAAILRKELEIVNDQFSKLVSRLIFCIFLDLLSQY